MASGYHIGQSDTDHTKYSNVPFKDLTQNVKVEAHE